MNKIWIVATGLLMSFSARATTMVWLPTEKLIAEANVIVVATSQTHQTYWRERRIYTSNTVIVEKTLKGSVEVGHKLVVLTLGGVVGNIGQHIPGSPIITVGNRFLLFLKEHAQRPHEWTVVGMAQGALPIGKPIHGGTPIEWGSEHIRMVGQQTTEHPTYLEDIEQIMKGAGLEK